MKLYQINMSTDINDEVDGQIKSYLVNAESVSDAKRIVSKNWGNWRIVFSRIEELDTQTEGFVGRKEIERQLSKYRNGEPYLP